MRRGAGIITRADYRESSRTPRHPTRQPRHPACLTPDRSLGWSRSAIRSSMPGESVTPSSWAPRVSPTDSSSPASGRCCGPSPIRHPVDRRLRRRSHRRGLARPRPHRARRRGCRPARADAMAAATRFVPLDVTDPGELQSFIDGLTEPGRPLVLYFAPSGGDGEVGAGAQYVWLPDDIRLALEKPLGSNLATAKASTRCWRPSSPRSACSASTTTSARRPC